MQPTAVGAPSSARRSEPSYDLPKSLAYDGGSPPEGYVLQHRTWKALWIPGAATFVISWLYTFMAAKLVDDENLGIPLVGPWMDLSDQENERARRLDVLAGALQGLGLGLLVAGLVTDDPRFLRADLATVQIAPVVNARLLGAQLSGSF